MGTRTKSITIFMGDFNYHIDCTNQIGKGSLEAELTECIQDDFLEKYIEVPNWEQVISNLVLYNKAGLMIFCKG